MVPPGQSEAKCSYCGEATAIEPGRFEEHREHAAEAREAEAEGEEALQGALAARYSTGALSLALVYGLAVVYLFGPMYIVARLDKLFELPSFLTMGLMIVIWVGVFASLAFRLPGRWLDARNRKRAKPLIAEAMNDIRSFVVAEPQQGTCPNCGAPVQVPASSARASCAFCDVPLMATLGMIVVWEQDAKERRKAWLAEARKVLERAHIVHVAQALLSPVALLLTIFASMGILVLLGMVL